MKFSATRKPTIVISMLAISILSFIARAGDNSPDVLTKGEHERMFIAGDGQKAWYSALELDQIAKKYVETKKIDFKFDGTSRTIWVKTDGGKALADVYYSSGMGKPVLNIQIGRDGNVIQHEIGTAICGTASRVARSFGTATRPAAP